MVHYPLLDLFEDPETMIGTVGDFGALLFHYGKKKIIRHYGQKLPGSENKDFTVGDSIFKFAPQSFYNQIDYIVKRFCVKRRNKKSGRYYIHFLCPLSQIGFITEIIYSIHVQIDIKNQKAILVYYRPCDEKNLNTQLLVISTPDHKNLNKLVYAINYLSIKPITLINHEFNVLTFLCKGYTSDDIAKLLFLSKHRVDEIRKEMLKKFDAKNIYQLVYHAQQKGFI
jgi:DNA-binding CsgD family transcriptional regulator